MDDTNYTRSCNRMLFICRSEYNLKSALIRLNLSVLAFVLILMTLPLMANASETTITASPPTHSGLDAAIRATNQHHPELAAKRSELKAAGYDVASHQARRYPSLSVQGSQRDDGDQLGLISLRQPVWAFGKIDTPIARSEAEHQAQHADLAQRQRQLATRTALAYARIQGAMARLRIAVDDQTQLKVLYDQIERRQQGQLASQSDVLLAAARLEQSRVRTNQISNELSIAINQLNTLTGIKVNPEPGVPQEYTSLSSQKEIRELALQRSTELAYQRLIVQIARLRVAEEKTQIYPTLYLVAQKQWTDDSDDSENRLLLTLEGNFDGMGLINRRNIDSARAKEVAALQELDASRNRLMEEVYNLTTNRQLQQNLADMLELSVQSLSDTLDSYQRQYAAGRKSWLELLNMQREVTQQRLLLQMANDQWLQASLQLAILTGKTDKLLGVTANE